jgi:putative transcriptional regulator
MIRILLSSILGERRITQAKLSEMTGIRPNTINELYHEYAERVSLQNLDLLCKTLDIELDELIKFVPDDSPEAKKPNR